MTFGTNSCPPGTATCWRVAGLGSNPLGWFYGFKLHLPANTNDQTPLRMQRFIDKLFGDKGYLSNALFEDLFFQGIHLVTKLRKNMKIKLVTPMADAILLRKRAICETIIDQLKNIFQIEHSRQRSPKNFLANLFSALIAYNFTEKRPILKHSYVDTGQLLPF